MTPCVHEMWSEAFIEIESKPNLGCHANLDMGIPYILVFASS